MPLETRWSTERYLNFVPSLYDPARAPQLNAAGSVIPGTGDPLNGIIVGGQNSPYGSKVARPLFCSRLQEFWSKSSSVSPGNPAMMSDPMAACGR